MTQKLSEKLAESPPPDYSASSPVPKSPVAHSGEDYLEEQVGGGRYVSPPIEQTPTRLRTRIKPTNRDIGLVKEASMRRRAMPVNETPTEGDTHTQADGSLFDEACGQSVLGPQQLPVPATGTLMMPPRIPSGSPQLQLAVPVQDIFYDPHIDPLQEPRRGHSQPPLQNYAQPHGPRQCSVPPPIFVPGVPRACSGTPAQPPQPNMIMKPTFSEHTYDFSGNMYDFSGMVNGSFNNSNNNIGTQLIIPATRVIPPTPAGLEDGVMQTETLMDEANIDAMMDEVSDFAVKGRRYDTTNAALQEGFLKLERVTSEISRSTSLPSHQIIALWNKSNTRIINNINHWNAYSNNFKTNFKQEISRLGDGAPKAPGTPSE